MKLLTILSIFLSAFGFHKANAENNSVSNTVSISVSNSVSDEDTGMTFTYKGITYPVYKSSRGNLYFLKTAKSGNKYRVYLVLDNGVLRKK